MERPHFLGFVLAATLVTPGCTSDPSDSSPTDAGGATDAGGSMDAGAPDAGPPSWPALALAPEPECGCADGELCLAGGGCAPRCDVAGGCATWTASQPVRSIRYHDGVVLWLTAPASGGAGSTELWQAVAPDGEPEQVADDVAHGDLIGATADWVFIHEPGSTQRVDRATGTVETILESYDVADAEVVSDSLFFAAADATGQAIWSVPVDLSEAPALRIGAEGYATDAEQRSFQTLAVTEDAIAASGRATTSSDVRLFVFDATTGELLLNDGIGGVDGWVADRDQQVTVTYFEASGMVAYDSSGQRTVLPDDSVGAPGGNDRRDVLHDGWLYAARRVSAEGSGPALVRVPTRSVQAPDAVLPPIEAPRTREMIDVLPFDVGGGAVYWTLNVADHAGARPIYRTELAAAPCETDDACGGTGHACIDGTCGP